MEAIITKWLNARKQDGITDIFIDRSDITNDDLNDLREFFKMSETETELTNDNLDLKDAIIEIAEKIQ